MNNEYTGSLHEEGWSMAADHGPVDWVNRNVRTDLRSKTMAFVIYKRTVAYRQGSVSPQRDHTNPCHLYGNSRKQRSVRA